MQEATVFAAAAGSLAVLLLGVFKAEFGFPVRVGVLLVPPIVGGGFGIAWAVHYRFEVSMLQAFGVLALGLFVLTLLYELWPRNFGRQVRRHY